MVTQPDLLDRALIYPMQRVTDSNRLEEKELDARFDTLKPKLLGAMFDALSGAMSAEIRHTEQLAQACGLRRVGLCHRPGTWLL